MKAVVQKVRHFMHYELWDVATGNCVGRYDSEADAMARVRSLIGQIGSPYADDLELLEEDEFGNLRGKATGASLIARAESVVASR
jgi:hypothetical protein